MSPQKLRFIGHQLEQLRKERGWTRKELLERIVVEPECEGTHEQTIYKWERGARPNDRPTLPQSIALEKVFRVPVRKWYEAVEAEAQATSPEPSSTPARPKFTPVPQDAATLDKIEAARKKIEDAKKGGQV